MATKYTTKELGIRILHEFYVRHDKCPGECHAIGTFVNTRGWSSDDLSNGLNYCVEKGWLEKVQDSFILTEKGFRVANLEGIRFGLTNCQPSNRQTSLRAG